MYQHVQVWRRWRFGALLLIAGCGIVATVCLANISVAASKGSSSPATATSSTALTGPAPLFTMAKGGQTWSFIGSLAGSFPSVYTSGATLSSNLSRNVSVGRILFAVCISDEVQGSTPTHDVYDSQGNTWHLVTEYTANSITGSLWWCRVTQALATTDTIYFELDNDVTAKGFSVQEASVSSSSISVAGFNTSSASNTTLASVGLDVGTSGERLWIGVIYQGMKNTRTDEDGNFGYFQVDTGFSYPYSFYDAVQIDGGDRVQTAATATFTRGFTASTSYIGILAAFEED